MNWKRYALDYALASAGELGLTHCISFGYRFGLVGAYYKGFKYYQRGFYDHAIYGWKKVPLDDPNYRRMLKMLNDAYQIKKWKR